MGTTKRKARITVLNASYEPISTTKLSRAVVMVQNGDAEVEETVPGRFIRSAAGVIPFPKVVRLIKYVAQAVKHMHRPAKWTKKGVLLRDKEKCVYCGKKATTIDHLNPKSKGGGNTWLNTAASCKACNNEKDDKTSEEYGKHVKVWEPTVYQLRAIVLASAHAF